MRGVRVLAALVALSALALLSVPGHAQGGSWLEAPLGNWNQPGMAIPRANSSPPDNPMCQGQGRPPGTHADHQLAERGWQLFSAYQAGWGVDVVHAGSSVDGMCRPMQFNVFVFHNGVFVGTVSPDLMDARTTGQEAGTTLLGPMRAGEPARLTSRFLRYASSDALCCPSLPAVTVTYQVTATPGGWVLVASGREQG